MLPSEGIISHGTDAEMTSLQTCRAKNVSEALEPAGRTSRKDKQERQAGRTSRMAKGFWIWFIPMSGEDADNPKSSQFMLNRSFTVGL